MRIHEGAILAGGYSRRMGRDKASITLGRLRLIDHVINAISPLVKRLRIIGSQETSKQFRPPLPYQIQNDLLPGKGPLAGIHTALATAKHPYVFVIACDLPLLTTRFLSGMCSQFERGYDAVAPLQNSVPVPVCAIYNRSCLSTVEELIDMNRLTAQDLLQSIRTKYIGNPILQRLDPTGNCLLNINTEKDYKRAHQIINSLVDPQPAP